MSRVAILPPGSPPDAVAALRQAFATLSKDEDFIAEANKAMRFHPRFDTGEDGEKLKQKFTGVSELVDFIRQFIDQAKVAEQNAFWIFAPPRLSSGHVLGFGRVTPNVFIGVQSEFLSGLIGAFGNDRLTDRQRSGKALTG
jgi:hypothetical protein